MRQVYIVLIHDLFVHSQSRVDTSSSAWELWSTVSALLPSRPCCDGKAGCSLRDFIPCKCSSRADSLQLVSALSAPTARADKCSAYGQRPPLRSPLPALAETEEPGMGLELVFIFSGWNDKTFFFLFDQ